MRFNMSRRAALAAGALLLAASITPAAAQDPVQLRFSAVFSEQDIRAEMMQRFADELGDDFDFQGYYGATLFRQGTELVALQRGNLEMGNIAPQDISEQLPAWSILTSAYLFRDVDHLHTFFDSEPGAEMAQLAEERLGVKVLGPTYFGSRHVGLRGDQRVEARPALGLEDAPGQLLELQLELFAAFPEQLLLLVEVLLAVLQGALQGGVFNPQLLMALLQLLQAFLKGLALVVQLLALTLLFTSQHTEPFAAPLPFLSTAFAVLKSLFQPVLFLSKCVK